MTVQIENAVAPDKRSLKDLCPVLVIPINWSVGTKIFFIVNAGLHSLTMRPESWGVAIINIV